MTRAVAGKELRVLWASPVPYVVGALLQLVLALLYVDQLTARPLVRLDHQCVELNVEAFEPAADAGHTRAHDDNVALLFPVNCVCAHPDP